MFEVELPFADDGPVVRLALVKRAPVEGGKSVVRIRCV